MELRRFIISIVSKFDSKGFDQAQKAGDRLKGSATGASRAVDGTTVAAKRAGKAHDGLAGSARGAGTEVSRAGGAARDASGKFTGLGGASKKASGGLGGLKTNLKGFATFAKKAAIGFAAVAAAVAAVAIPVLTTGAEFEGLQARLNNLLGSTAKGAKAFEFIQGFAAKTPFSLQQVTSAFLDLQTRGVEPTARRLTALGDLSSSFGGDLQSITDGIAAASRGEFESIRKYGVMAKAEGDKVALSFRGQRVEVENTAEAITDALVKFGEMNGIQGAMAVQSATLAGQWSNASDTLSQFLNTAAQSGPLKTAGEILGTLQKKFLDPQNAKLLGQALDEIFQHIKEALDGVDPKDVTAGFKALLNIVKLIVLALKPFLWIAQQLLSTLPKIAEYSGMALKLGQEFFSVATGATALEDSITTLGVAFGVLNNEGVETGNMLDLLRTKAKMTADAIKLAVSGAVMGTKSVDELRAIANDGSQNAEFRAAATKELNRRQEEDGSGRLKAKEAKRAKDEIAFDPTDALDKAAKSVGETAADAEFKRLRKSGVDEETAKREASVAGVTAQEKERERLGAGGKIKGKGKGGKKDVFFDFEKDAAAAARTQGEAFAATELERLRSEGIAVDEAIAQSQAAGEKRAADLKEKFLQAGRIFDASADNILDILGLRGPGSVLEGRPPPQTLLITFSPEINFIKQFNQTIESVEGAKALSEITGQGGQAAAEQGLDKFRAMFEVMFTQMMGLQMDRLVKAGAGGTQPVGPQG